MAKRRIFRSMPVPPSVARKRRRIILFSALVIVILVVGIMIGYTRYMDARLKQEIAEEYGISPDVIEYVKRETNMYVGTITVIKVKGDDKEYVDAKSVIEAAARKSTHPTMEFNPAVLKSIDKKIYVARPEGVDWDKLVNETVMMLIDKVREISGGNKWLCERRAVWYIDGKWIYEEYFGSNPTGKLYGARLGGWYQANESVRISFDYDPKAIPDPYNWTIEHMFRGHNPDDVVMFFIVWHNGTYVVYEQLVPVMKVMVINKDFGVFIVGIQKLFGDPVREHGCEKVGPDGAVQLVPGCYGIMLIFDKDGNLLYARIA